MTPPLTLGTGDIFQDIHRLLTPKTGLHKVDRYFIRKILATTDACPGTARGGKTKKILKDISKCRKDVIHIGKTVVPHPLKTRMTVLIIALSCLRI